MRYNESIVERLNALIDIQRAQLYYTLYKDLSMGEASKEDIKRWGDKFQNTLTKVVKYEDEL